MNNTTPSDDVGNGTPREVSLPDDYVDDPVDDWLPLNKPNVNKELDNGP